jgi:hypothetical protein
VEQARQEEPEAPQPQQPEPQPEPKPAKTKLPPGRPPATHRVPMGVSEYTAELLRSGSKVQGRAVRNTQKEGYDVNGTRGHLKKGSVYLFPPDVFLVLYEARYVDEYAVAS